MTRLFNDPADFADELVAGFVAANRDRVRAVPGGVVRSTASAPGTAALVIGGGSGHYPAFGGLVGPGLAHGAAMGNLFASPSTQQVLSVARAASNGGGVLLSYGNYAGDVLNFDAAEARLNAEGIPTRTVVVTDDISSAPASERHKRRGIAGDLTVFKVAGAAAEEGASLDELVRIATKANDRTRSFGVAFGGCTLPGASEPLFSVPDGRMAVGLGIHGEPGIGETDIPTADGLAELFVEKLLGELPDDVPSTAGQRAVVILNGLGSVKYEELFVVYGGVARRLEEAGVEIAGSEVGEFCTSFDMAGASLTLFWVDEELEHLWHAPADSPAFRTGRVEARSAAGAGAQADETGTPDAVPPASDASRRAAARLADALAALAATIDENVAELGRIDAVAGDGDHGIGMQRGATAAVRAATEARDAGVGAGTLLERAADAWSHRAGGTSGALWGVMLRAAGERLGDESEPDAATAAAAVRDALDGIRRFGKAEVGDKTMVDAIVPFAETLATRVDAGDSLVEAWTEAARAARDAAAATAELLPRMGRARPHAEKSLGTPDAGAHSFALAVTAVGATLSRKDPS
ncbi:dihydroxyacetone kinase family protein [Protaetiibacter sp. SSC-01]|uniref:dihydroxyacetone kinase family protein n=1 Tax=Protaetiibacter sp. SSC-01 TaxID=2759943 RepID=UPI0016570598|nr:dihydroxyacetone kinase family protein [Protaetiibacter sp. SSC-01]QNO36902.1 dihydroxyacetone kinase family protein [Protaetiibacter sp. SSC-01]